MTTNIHSTAGAGVHAWDGMAKEWSITIPDADGGGHRDIPPVNLNPIGTLAEQESVVGAVYRRMRMRFEQKFVEDPHTAMHQLSRDLQTVKRKVERGTCDEAIEHLRLERNAVLAEIQTATTIVQKYLATATDRKGANLFSAEHIANNLLRDED